MTRESFMGKGRPEWRNIYMTKLLRIGALIAMVSCLGSVGQAEVSSLGTLTVSGRGVPVALPDPQITCALGSRLPMFQETQPQFVALVRNGDGESVLAAFQKSDKKGTPVGWVTNEGLLIFAEGAQTTSGQYYLKRGEVFPVVEVTERAYVILLEARGQQAVLKVPTNTEGITYRETKVASVSPAVSPAPAPKAIQKASTKSETRTREQRLAAARLALARKRAVERKKSEAAKRALTEKEAARAKAEAEQDAEINVVEMEKAEASAMAEVKAEQPVATEDVAVASEVDETKKASSVAGEAGPGVPAPVMEMVAAAGEPTATEVQPEAVGQAEHAEAVTAAANTSPMVPDAEVDSVEAEEDGGFLSFFEKHSMSFHILLLAVIFEGLLIVKLQKKTTMLVSAQQEFQKFQDLEHTNAKRYFQGIADQRQDFAGSLEAFSVFDLIEFLRSSEDTGMLYLKDKGGETDGGILFDKGNAIHAFNDELVGEEAFLHLVGQEHDHFSFDRMEKAVGEKTIKSATISLLLIAAKAADETIAEVAAKASVNKMVKQAAKDAKAEKVAAGDDPKETDGAQAKPETKEKKTKGRKKAADPKPSPVPKGKPSKEKTPKAPKKAAKAKPAKDKAAKEKVKKPAKKKGEGKLPTIKIPKLKLGGGEKKTKGAGKAEEPALPPAGKKPVPPPLPDAAKPAPSVAKAPPTAKPDIPAPAEDIANPPEPAPKSQPVPAPKKLKLSTKKASKEGDAPTEAPVPPPVKPEKGDKPFEIFE